MTFCKSPYVMRAVVVLLTAFLCVAGALGLGCSSTSSTSGPSEPDGFALPEVVLVQAGSFTMGDGLAGCGVDEHEVTLTHDFHLCQHQVTNQEYLDAVQWAYDHGYVTATASSVQDSLDGSTAQLVNLAGGCEIAFSDGVFSLRDAGHGVDPEHPVMDVTWYGAARYCDWLSLMVGSPRAYENDGDWSCNGGDPYSAEGYRLPTDAEWEYAARYDDERIYPWGDEVPSCDLANFQGCVGWTSPVGNCPAGNSALGLADMAGNVYEWCNDWFSCDLGTDAQEDPTGVETGSSRVARGGSWFNDDSKLACAARSFGSPAGSHRSIGFRAAISVGA